jgi:nucleoside-diphosphate-sugar epimerase
MNRVLVTGARGFLGCPIANLLVERGWDVIRTATTPCQEHVVVDLLDDAAVLALVRKVEATHLVHAAWKSVHGDVMRSTDNLAWLRSSLGLVKCFREAGGRRTAILGTSAEYDWTNGVCRNGVTPLRPATLYGACKHALHVTLEAYAGASGLEFVWPRVFSAYGPGEHESRLVPSVIRALVRGEVAKCTHGRQVLDYVHVNDIAAGVVASLESDHQGSIDITSGVGISVRDVVATIARLLDGEDLVRFGARPNPDRDFPMVVGDGAEAHLQLGWSTTLSLEEGIAGTIEWGRAVFAPAAEHRMQTTRRVHI